MKNVLLALAVLFFMSFGVCRADTRTASEKANPGRATSIKVEVKHQGRRAVKQEATKALPVDNTPENFPSLGKRHEECKGRHCDEKDTTVEEPKSEIATDVTVGVLSLIGCVAIALRRRFR